MASTDLYEHWLQQKNFRANTSRRLGPAHNSTAYIWDVLSPYADAIARISLLLKTHTTVFRCSRSRNVSKLSFMINFIAPDCFENHSIAPIIRSLCVLSVTMSSCQTPVSIASGNLLSRRSVHEYRIHLKITPMIHIYMWYAGPSTQGVSNNAPTASYLIVLSIIYYFTQFFIDLQHYYTLIPFVPDLNLIKVRFQYKMRTV